MLKPALIFLLPFGLTLALAGLIRFFGGAERGVRAAGFAIAISFIIGWGVVLTPGWIPGDAFARIGHIALGAALVGLVLDLWSPKRFCVAVIAGIVVLVCTWASLNGGLAPQRVTAGFAALLVVFAAGAFLILARLDRARSRGITALVLLAMAGLALAAMAGVAGDHRLAVTALMLALAVIAYGFLQGVVPLAVGDSVILGAGSTLLAVAWALAEGAPESRLALLLVPLILFAEGTADRIPLPRARISALLYPAVLAGVAALPLTLAVLVTYVMAHA